MEVVTDDRGVSGTAGAEVPVIPPDDFSDAFNEATTVGDRSDLSTADDPGLVKDEGEVKEVAVVPVVEAPVVTDAGTAGVVESPTPTSPVIPINEQQPGESDEKYEQRYKTLQGIHRHDKEAWEIEKAGLQKQIEEAKAATPAAPVTKQPTKEEAAAATQAFLDSLTDDQKAALKTYEEEFDVVSKMEGIKREAALGALKKELQTTLDTWKAELTNQFTTQIAPALSLKEDIDQASHFDAIRQGHADFETHRDSGAILKWIEAKPKYLQASLKQTYEQGSAEDVVDLITDFKRENNITESVIESPDPQKVVDLNAKKAEKKQNLTAPTGRRGAVQLTQPATDDFEGAFDEALHNSGG